MPRSWADAVETERWERGLENGTSEPYLSDLDVAHDEGLEQADFAYNKGGQAYVEAPSDRERREHFDEMRAQNDLRPRTGEVTVLPAQTRCSCGARETGHAHPGHRYGCPRYSLNPRKDVAA